MPFPVMSMEKTSSVKYGFYIWLFLYMAILYIIYIFIYGYFWFKTRKIKLQGKRWWIAIYCKLCIFVTESYSPSSLLACCQHILVLLLHILWRGCYVAWYYYHQFLVLLLKLFVSWPHHTALRTMMKVTTVEWCVWIVGRVCLFIFLACKEGIDTDLK